MTRKTTLVIFEQFPEATRFFIVLATDHHHVNAAIAAAGNEPSMEAMEQFVKLVYGGYLTEIRHDGCGVIDDGDDVIDRIVHVICDG
jgi:hypothetical protein